MTTKRRNHRSGRQAGRRPSTWPPLGRGQWRPEDVARLVINPFYAVELAPTLCALQSVTLTRGQWVTASAALIDELGPRAFLDRLVAALTGAETLPAGGVTSPAAAIVIAESLCEPHELLIEREQWLDANVALIGDLGPRAYLALLLDVLAGNYV